MACPEAGQGAWFADMSSNDDFASFMEQGSGGWVQRLRQGDRVTGPVTHLGGDSVFIDLGGRADGRIPRAELCDAHGELHVELGQSLEATVIDPDADGGPLLAVTLGRDSRLDLASLELSLRSQTPVEAVVTRAVKGGLEVELGGVRGFCPGSQLERGYASDLAKYVGERLRVLVLEIKDDGRSVVVSRRRVLELERQQAGAATLSRLEIGRDVGGTVASIQSYGAFVDLGGVEGLVHISEISHSRVDRVEDVLSVGEAVTVRVLAIEDGDKGKRIRLSMKAPRQADAVPVPAADEILPATVVRLLPHGLLVETSKGQGLVPKRELGLPPGADHRRAFAVEQALEVVLLDGREGSYRFSHARVESVRARKDFAEYQSSRVAGPVTGVGSFGALLAGVNRAELPPGSPPPATSAEGPAWQKASTAHESPLPPSSAPSPAAPTAGHGKRRIVRGRGTPTRG